MNYLAHAFLSFNQPGILTGNMISDFVKGKQQFDYPPIIQKGIRLHRFIDTFTDNHPATHAAKQFLKPAVGPYAGAFVDVVYDHFLATDNAIYTEEEWLKFSQWVYEQLALDEALLPPRFAQMLPYMTRQNWLLNYRHRWGIERSFEGVVRRAAYLDSSVAAFRAFETHYAQFEMAYQLFMPDVKKAASDFFNES